jgi:hypothetical protein
MGGQPRPQSRDPRTWPGDSVRTEGDELAYKRRGLELDERRYRLDAARFERENQFWNRRMGATISLVAVVITATQLWFNIKKGDRDRADQRLRDERESQMKSAKGGLAVGRLLIDKQSELFAMSAGARQRARDAFLIDLPPTSRTRSADTSSARANL